MKKQTSNTNLTVQDIEEITRSAFLKEIDSVEYHTNYSPERQVKTLLAFYKVIKFLKKKQKKQADITQICL